MFGMDLAPLRTAPAFRRLIISRTITLFGAQATVVALLVQIRGLTGSAFAVGALGGAKIPPIVICGLLGGHLADRFARRTLALIGEGALALVAIGLLLNSLDAHPHVWLIYAAAASVAGLTALQRPALDATVPRLVDCEQLTAASAALSLSSNVSFMIGSAVGGLVVASAGARAAYALDAGTYLASLVCLGKLRLPPLPARAPAGTPGSSVDALAGLRYLAGRPDLIGSYLVDLAAMGLAFPESLYPFMATTLHAAWALGLMFSMTAIGATLASVTSGWSARVRRYGLAVALAGIAWAVATAVFGVAPDLPVALAALTLAGVADLLSGLFRDTLWNPTVPDAIRGRLAGIEVVSYGLGPALGQLRAGAVASVTGPRVALWSGGALCVVAIALTCRRLPGFVAGGESPRDHAPPPHRIPVKQPRRRPE